MKRRTATVLALIALILATGLTCLVNPSRADSKHDRMDTSLSSQPELTCPKCKGPMERGVMLDYSQPNVPGQFQWSVRPQSQRLFAKKTPRKKVFTYRCTNCGYLESYAN
jgi:hypothetical protein